MIRLKKREAVRLLLSFAIIMVLLISLAIVVGVLGSQKHITQVSIDLSSDWGRYFLAETGYPVVRIQARAGPRTYVDYVSFVGAERPSTWFEEHGFSDLSTSNFRGSATGFLDNVGPLDNVINLKHTKNVYDAFWYVPSIGVLVTEAVDAEIQGQYSH